MIPQRLQIVVNHHYYFMVLQLLFSHMLCLIQCLFIQLLLEYEVVMNLSKTILLLLIQVVVNLLVVDLRVVIMVLVLQLLVIHILVQG